MFPNEFVICPHCQAQIADGGRLAGQVVACPRCHGQFQVAAPAGPPQIEEIEVEESAVASAARGIKLVGILGAILVVVLLGVLYSLDIISFGRASFYERSADLPKIRTTVDKFNEIDNRMTEAEVVQLLGPPKGRSEIPDKILGNQVLCRWEKDGKWIQIRFVGGKVYDKVIR